MSIDAVAEGVTTTIALFGEKLNLLDFAPGHDTIAFGPGITIVPGSIVVSADGKKITLKIKVATGGGDTGCKTSPSRTIRAASSHVWQMSSP